MDWRGVLPAVTTPFAADGRIDHDFLKKHVGWLADHGCRGIVALGSLGEGATLGSDEKRDILRSCVEAVGGRIAVVAGIAALSTDEAVDLADFAKETGCQGLMVLPPYVYQGDWPETRAHFDAVIGATGLSCMLYNNPIAYGTDVLPHQVRVLAERHANLHSVKESSGDIRRMTGIRAECGDRLAIFVGLDDLIVEGMMVGATGWVAGLVNALPRESVELYELCRRKEWDLAFRLYKWFLPLLRLDTVPKFVQLIKLVQAEVGWGSERVRPPRLPLEGAERDAALAIIRESLANRPSS
ncbi:MAG: dihydrodipicolinate synthase family protein [Fimbriimonadaceae bacterium]|nr:dihydrodipicolinate synthase family protein [Fimbriimonadaceae bacterium]QYK58316.1 MAG: dihydrodipicolinate synthase family protein [Fimbriimonadaceae bacterium]